MDETIIKRVPIKLKKNSGDKIKIIPKENQIIKTMNKNISPVKRIKKEEDEDIAIIDEDELKSVLSEDDYDIETTTRKKPVIYKSPNHKSSFINKLNEVNESVKNIENKFKDGELDQETMDNLDLIMKTFSETEKEIIKQTKPKIKKTVVRKKSVLDSEDKKPVRKISKTSMPKDTKDEIKFKNYKFQALKFTDLEEVNERNMKYMKKKFNPKNFGFLEKNGIYIKMANGNYTNYVDFPAKNVKVLVIKNNGRNFKIRNSAKKVIAEYTPGNNQIANFDDMTSNQYAILRNTGEIELAFLY